MPKMPNQQPTDKLPTPPKTNKEMFMKHPSPVPGSDIGRPKHKLPQQRK
jgi:hypothetical protein